MKITRITENNKEAFEDLMPGYIAEDDSYVLLGVVADEDIACSCLAAVINGNSLHIDWLYTDPDYRNQGAAGMLLETLLMYIDNSSTSAIEIAFNDEIEGIEDFLTEMGFIIVREDDIYRVPISDLLYNVQMDDMLEVCPEPAGIRSPEEGSVRTKLKEYLTEHGDDEEMTDIITDRLSIVRTNEHEEITGCLLIREAADTDLEVMAFYNDGSVTGITELTVGMYQILTWAGLEDGYMIFADHAGEAVHFVEELTGEDSDDYRINGILRGILFL